MKSRFAKTALAVAVSIAFQPAFGSTEDEATVVVTATRIPTRVDEQLADVAVITREDIEAAGATTLPSLLAQQPGLQIVTNGGIGKSTSLFTRGTNAGHTLLLVDGVPLGSATLGQPSLTNLPLTQIERIEILRGPASSLYGSDAIGGVVQIFTRQGEGPMKPEAFAGAGSYGAWQAQVGLSGGGDLIAYSLQAAKLETAGWDATLPKLDALHRDRDGYRNASWQGRIAVTPVKGQEFGATFLTIDSRNHYDDRFSAATVDSYNDDATSVWSLYAKNRLFDAWTSTLRYGESKDRSENFSPAKSLFATQQKQWSWQNDVKLPLGILMLAYEDLRQDVESTTNFSVKERTVRSAIGGWQARLGNHSWQLTQRYDDNSQFGAKTTGSLAYGYRILPTLTARVAFGTAFKAPSFNDLYYTSPWGSHGNPNLQPETARNREIGLDWSGPTGAHLGWSHFDNRIKNLISWQNTGGFVYVPFNIGRARIVGDSFTAGHHWGAWSAQLSLDLMRPYDEDTGKRLPRRAAQQAKARVAFEPGAWAAGAELVAVGKRFDTATETKEMARYELVNLFAHFRLGRDLRLEGRIDNLFDKKYETAWGYANPGTMVFVGLRYQPR
ncbi:TonB-dependent receptor domain-containing protein [Sulfuricystis multivorans]|uniref:TonB-dependent receptor domain-containing protein n=1 Tax=Sulfuricystis multivorans TaxID=2211108 RepID=UPI000F833BAA|nr:TonB-dependent receptor [Sulfuricystis multivorans]